MANIKHKLLESIEKRKMTFLGHVMHRNGIQNLSLTRKIKGKRTKGRLRMTYLNNIKEWTNTATHF